MPPLQAIEYHLDFVLRRVDRQRLAAQAISAFLYQFHLRYQVGRDRVSH